MEKKHLKEVLKAINVLYIVKKNNRCKKTLNTLSIFFNHVLEARNIKEATEIYIKSRPAVIITDVDLDSENGITFIKDVRRTNKQIPILILSAKKDEAYLFEAIKLNLVDYLLYPLDVSKFINALNTVAKNIAHEGKVEVKFINNYKYNFITKTVIDCDNKSLNLTKNEFRLLEFLIDNHQKTISKEEIESHLWADEYITDSAFKSLFSRLRNKIGKETIVNSFGVGYNIELIE